MGLTPRRWAVAAVAIHTLLAGTALMANGGDPVWFVHFGSDPARSPVTELGRDVFGDDVITPNLDGHDGRYFWVQAGDPLLRDPDRAVRWLDRPVYRSQRPLYPIAVAPFGLLGDRALAAGLVLVNLVAVGVAAWATACWTERLAAHRWTPLTVIVGPAAVTALLLSTSDTVAVAATLTALWFVVQDRPWAAGGAFLVAGLTKEVMLAPVVTLAALDLIRQQRLRWSATTVLPGLMVVAAWAIYVRIRLPGIGNQVQELTWPLTGYIDAWRHQWFPLGDWAQALTAVAVLSLGVVAILRWWNRGGLVAWAALPFAVLTPLFTKQVVGLATNPPRAIGPLLTLVVIDLTSRPHATDRWPAPRELATALVRSWRPPPGQD